MYQPLRFKVGDLVSRFGDDIHRVVEIDDECYFGVFECLFDLNEVSDFGERESNLACRYDKITQDKHPELYQKAKSRGWL